jgi:RES domain-containing protein
VIAWRLAPARRPEVAFAGEGARRYGGRWNPVGVPVVYAATTLSLAALEILGHVDPEEARPYFFYRVDVPDEGVERLAPSALPRRWNAPVPPRSTAKIGAAWAAAGRSVALLVPSVHVPTGEELNVLLNPRHADFARVAVGAARPYSFDPRVLPRRRG